MRWDRNLLLGNICGAASGPGATRQTVGSGFLLPAAWFRSLIRGGVIEGTAPLGALIGGCAAALSKLAARIWLACRCTFGVRVTLLSGLASWPPGGGATTVGYASEIATAVAKTTCACGYATQASLAFAVRAAAPVVLRSARHTVPVPIALTIAANLALRRVRLLTPAGAGVPSCRAFVVGAACRSTRDTVGLTTSIATRSGGAIDRAGRFDVHAAGAGAITGLAGARA